MKFRAVVGVQTQNDKWKVMEYRFEYRRPLTLLPHPTTCDCVTAFTALM
jgi:hypothetical protein